MGKSDANDLLDQQGVALQLRDIAEILRQCFETRSSESRSVAKAFPTESQQAVKTFSHIQAALAKFPF